jgi:uncharacterized protein
MRGQNGNKRLAAAIGIPNLSSMPSCQLSAVETRILGCLLEKERTTPENYPLSLNSLALACNQSTNRDPVVGYDEKTVENGVNALREKKLATVVFGAGSRVQKYRHNLLDHYAFERQDLAILCVLLLRGPQTPGELRSRTERMYGFPSIEEVESTLEALGKDASPLVRLLPARLGQKERRYVQLFSDESVLAEYDSSPSSHTFDPIPKVIPESRLDALEKEVATLKEDARQLREEFAAFRKQFE